MISRLAFQGAIKTFNIGGKSVEAEKKDGGIFDAEAGDIIIKEDKKGEKKVYVADSFYHFRKDRVAVTDPNKSEKDVLHPFNEHLRGINPLDSYKVYCQIEKPEKNED